ncbi:hypothetical protein BV20DRAFT_963295 [Pilatotrama ljubarskyi]|nr:hypothetical protein BV20DRAFT_963295 [Pilatotrama ljubarskyi]
MPFVRCRWYDDSGAPIGRGCSRGPDCPFVHPSESGWNIAPKPRTAFVPRGEGQAFPRTDRPRDGGWNQRGGRGGGGVDRGRGGRGGAAGGRPDASASAAPPPTAPRALASLASDWGPSSLGGTSWDTGNADNNATEASSSGPAQSTATWGVPADASSSAGVPSLDWSNPTVDWNVPPEPSTITWGQPPPSPPPAGQTSPDQETRAAESVVWGDASRNRDAAPSSTPRTPRSPQRSPQRDRGPPPDPRRRPSLSTTPSSQTAGAAASPSDEVAAAVVSRESRREETCTLSWGVPVPVSLAGPSGSSSSKSNPFSFPEYTPAEKMDVVSEPMGDASREVNMAEVEDSSRAGSRAASRAASPAPSPVEERPNTTLGTWKRYVRILTKAVALSNELKRLNELRERQRAMQRSSQYRSASMVAAHAQIEKVRSENDSKLRHAQKRFDECLEKLAGFPIDGPSSSLEPISSPEIESVRQWVAEIQTWMESIRPTVQQYQDTARAIAQAKEEAEAAARAEAEARAAALQEAQSRAASAIAAAEELEEKMGDLEYRFEELRVSRPEMDEQVSVALRALEQRLGISLQAPDTVGDAFDKSLEDGEVRPPPPKTRAELSKESAELQRQLTECNERLARTLKQMEAEKARNLTKDLAYHQLAVDQTEMRIKLDELSSQQEEVSKTIMHNCQELKALRQKLQEHKQREPPPLPPAVTFDELTMHILPILRPELRDALHAGLSAVRRGVDEALCKQQEDICEQVWTAFQPVLRLIASVKHMSDRQPEILMPPPPPPMQSVQHS